MVGVSFQALIAGGRKGTMREAVNALGLTSGLQLCLDASDVNSYTGAGQSWLDTSGNGYDFFRGTTSGADSTDPTFNGSAGGQSLSEYWSFDGGDRFTYDSANETWMNNLHKNSATFTFAFWVRLASLGSTQSLVATMNATTEIGINIYVHTTGEFAIDVAAGDGNDEMTDSVVSDATVSAGAWTFLALSGDEPSGNWITQVNGTQKTQTSITYSGPSSSAADRAMSLGARGGGTFPFLSGGRMASAVAWSSARTAAELDSLYQLTRSKFGV